MRSFSEKRPEYKGQVGRVLRLKDVLTKVHRSKSNKGVLFDMN